MSQMSESPTECPLCWVEAHAGNPSNSAFMRPISFAIPPTYRTPKVRFYFLAVDHILKAVTLSRQVIARLEILRERAEGSEVEKINNIISNIKEINEELIEMKTSMERRGKQPTHRPMRIRDTAELDRRTKTETLIHVTWGPIRNIYRFLEIGKGNLRGLRARLLETGEIEEARNVEREMEKLTEIETEFHEKEGQIQELKLGNPGTHSRGDCPLCWIEAHAGNPNSIIEFKSEKEEEIKDLFKSLHSITVEQDIINLTIRRLIDDSTDPRWLPIHIMDAANAIILEISSGEGHILNVDYVQEKLTNLSGYSYQIRGAYRARAQEKAKLLNHINLN